MLLSRWPYLIKGPFSLAGRLGERQERKFGAAAAETASEEGTTMPEVSPDVAE